MIRLSRVTRGIRTPVFAKAEFINPGGSLKDRIGLPIIERAEREGRLKPGGTIVEGTSGNTGIGLAIAAAFKGYKCVFTMPDKMSQEKVRLLKAFGAEVIVTPTAVPPDHPDNYVMMAKRIASETPNAILANQFYNDANSAGALRHDRPGDLGADEGEGDALRVRRRHRRDHHRRRTLSQGKESGDPDHRRRSCRLDSLRHVAVEGRKQAGRRAVQGRGDRAGQGSRHARHERHRRFHDRERQGILRDGAAPHARRRVFSSADRAGSWSTSRCMSRGDVDDPNALVVVPLPDTGERYLSKLYNDEWMRENQLLDADRTTLAFVLEAKARSSGDTPIVVSVAPGATVRQALGLMSLHDVSQLPVMDGTNCVGSVSDWSLSAKSLDNTKLLDATVSEVMDPPFPTVDLAQPVDNVAKLLSKSNPAVLVRSNGTVQGIVTRSDMLNYLMAR